MDAVKSRAAVGVINPSSCCWAHESVPVAIQDFFSCWFWQAFRSFPEGFFGLYFGFAFVGFGIAMRAIAASATFLFRLFFLWADVGLAGSGLAGGFA